jgi:hypothetical protein
VQIITYADSILKIVLFVTNFLIFHQIVINSQQRPFDWEKIQPKGRYKDQCYAKRAFTAATAAAAVIPRFV